jgi:hypothetical protein
MPAEKQKYRFPIYGLRMSPALKQRLSDAAHDNRRSLHAEIIGRLETSLVLESPTVRITEAAAWFRTLSHEQQTLLATALTFLVEGPPVAAEPDSSTPKT